MSASQVNYYSFAVLMVVNYFLYETFYLCYLLLCVCFSWDLYQTIKNPLYPAKKRMMWYMIFTTLSIIILFWIEH